MTVARLWAESMDGQLGFRHQYRQADLRRRFLNGWVWSQIELNDVPPGQLRPIGAFLEKVNCSARVSQLRSAVIWSTLCGPSRFYI